ncbi:amidohydrolase [Herbiconiux moechotypicola]|uniref:Amidohydrolase n=1 Tax=Herbiconiux moechotypicola TaxID=637393 RepID=A0ABN3E2J8_9MICO|nr:amidohydrolase [Herbiconiux moechotypicola]MCS5731325.1 amidohydrolase [Herbiconiux moechotypicola]
MKLDTLIENGRIWTGDARRPWATRIGVFAGRVIGVDDELDGTDAETRLDLGGAPAVPGFHDAHLHFSLYGHRLLQVDLSITACPDLDSLYRAVQTAAEAAEPGEWVLGTGYDQNKLGAHPLLSVLDRVAPENPVFLEHTSGHMGVANSAAFRAGGHGDLRLLPRIDGGLVETDAEGLPTGLLQERAQELVNELFLPVTLATHRRGSRLASAELLSLGITSITEPGVGVPGQIGRTPIEIRAYQDGIDAGEINLRLNVMPYIRAFHELGEIGGGEEGWGLDLGIRSGLGDDRLRLTGVKVLTDGSLIGRTAAVCCEFHDAPGNTGLLIQDESELKRMVVGAHRNGWQVAMHAIGDHALDLVMDAVDEAQRLHPRADPRHRIEHCGISRPDQLDRVAALGLIPDPQGTFLLETGDGLLAAVGPDRMEMLYRMASWLERDIVLPGSTDAPIVAADPIRSIHAMVNRRTEQGQLIAPEEGITPAQALRAYTYGSAYAAHEEHRKGTLSRGMLADLAVLSDDLLAVAPDRLDGVSVGATIVGGELVHDSGAVTRS